MKKSRRILMAGAAATVFSSVVGSAAFLTLSSPRAEFLPEGSLWQNSLLPGAAERTEGYSASPEADFLSMDFAAYGSAFTGALGGSGQVQLAAIDPANGNSPDSGTGHSDASMSGGGSSPTAGSGSGAEPTFSSTPSAWDALRFQLGRSIEPGSSLAGGGGGQQLAEFNPDDTMTPGLDDQLQPIDQQPLPERPVPEPQSWALLALGLVGLSALRYRRKA